MKGFAFKANVEKFKPFQPFNLGTNGFTCISKHGYDKSEITKVLSIKNLTHSTHNMRIIEMFIRIIKTVKMF